MQDSLCNFLVVLLVYTIVLFSQSWGKETKLSGNQALFAVLHLDFLKSFLTFHCGLRHSRTKMTKTSGQLLYTTQTGVEAVI